MALSDAMLAQALLDYFDQHTEDFETFLLDRAAIGDGYVLWQGDAPHKRVLIAFTIFGGEGRTLSHRTYAIKIAAVEPRRVLSHVFM